MFQNNSELCNSACQSFTLTTFLRSKRTLAHQKCERKDGGFPNDINANNIKIN